MVQCTRQLWLQGIPSWFLEFHCWKKENLNNPCSLLLTIYQTVQTQNERCQLSCHLISSHRQLFSMKTIWDVRCAWGKIPWTNVSSHTFVLVNRAGERQSSARGKIGICHSLRSCFGCCELVWSNSICDRFCAKLKFPVDQFKHDIVDHGTMVTVRVKIWNPKHFLGKCVLACQWWIMAF